MKNKITVPAIEVSFESHQALNSFLKVNKVSKGETYSIETEKNQSNTEYNLKIPMYLLGNAQQDKEVIKIVETSHEIDDMEEKEKALEIGAE